MFQEITSLNEGQYQDYCLSEQPSFENMDSYFYQSFSSVNDLFDNNIVQPTFDFQNKSGDLYSNNFSSQPSNMANNFVNPAQFPQHDLPAIATSTDLQWITTSDTNIRLQSPLDPSSPKTSISPSYSSRSTSSTLFSSEYRSLDSAPEVTISHHKFSSQSDNAVEDNLGKKLPEKAPEPPKKTKGTPGRKRKFQDHELSPAEAARRNLRRERNKIAAAKCRNRRRDLTNQLQEETDRLEDNQQLLQQEIIALQREKHELELLLASHRPHCKAGIFDSSEESASRDCYHLNVENKFSLELQKQDLKHESQSSPELIMFHNSSKNHPEAAILSFQSSQNNTFSFSNNNYPFFKKSGQNPIQSYSNAIPSHDYVNLPSSQVSNEQISSNLRPSTLATFLPQNSYNVSRAYNQHSYSGESDLSNNTAPNLYFSSSVSSHPRCTTTTENSTKQQENSYNFQNENLSSQIKTTSISPSKSLVAL